MSRSARLSKEEQRIARLSDLTRGTRPHTTSTPVHSTKRRAVAYQFKPVARPKTTTRRGIPSSPRAAKLRSRPVRFSNTPRINSNVVHRPQTTPIDAKRLSTPILSSRLRQTVEPADFSHGFFAPSDELSVSSPVHGYTTSTRVHHRPVTSTRSVRGRAVEVYLNALAVKAQKPSERGRRGVKKTLNSHALAVMAHAPKPHGKTQFTNACHKVYKEDKRRKRKKARPGEHAHHGIVGIPNDGDLHLCAVGNEVQRILTGKHIGYLRHVFDKLLNGRKLMLVEDFAIILASVGFPDTSAKDQCAPFFRYVDKDVSGGVKFAEFVQLVTTDLHRVFVSKNEMAALSQVTSLPYTGQFGGTLIGAMFNSGHITQFMRKLTSMQRRKNLLEILSTASRLKVHLWDIHTDRRNSLPG